MLLRPTGPMNVQDWYVDSFGSLGGVLFANLRDRLRQSDCILRIKIEVFIVYYCRSEFWLSESSQIHGHDNDCAKPCTEQSFSVSH